MSGDPSTFILLPKTFPPADLHYFVDGFVPKAWKSSGHKQMHSKDLLSEWMSTQMERILEQLGHIVLEARVQFQRLLCFPHWFTMAGESLDNPVFIRKLN